MILPATKHTRNIHEVTCQSGQEFLLVSDLHWDNPHCDRGLLKNHLDEAVKRNAAIILNGDTYCCMGGKYDRRADKSLIRPEHNTDRYFDAIVDTSVEWFAPYAKNILLIGYGNHETAIIKRTSCNASPAPSTTPQGQRFKLADMVEPLTSECCTIQSVESTS
jgi:hypothetical protein